MKYRAIRDNVPNSESLSGLSDGAERLYWRIVSQSDSWGRGEAGSDRKLLSIVGPLIDKWTPQLVKAMLNELIASGRLVVYEVEGKRYWEVTAWDENQPRDVLGRSGTRFTSQHPDAAVRGSTRQSAAPRGTCPPDSDSDSEGSSEAKASSRKPDELWDALVQEMGEPKTRSERGRRNKALKELRDIGATAGEVRLRSSAYRKQWPDVAFTATALTANWSVLEGTNGKPELRCPECELPFAGQRTLDAHRGNVHGVQVAA